MKSHYWRKGAVALAGFLLSPYLAIAETVNLSTIDTKQQAEFAARFGKGATVQTIRIPNTPEDPFIAPIDLGGVPLHLDLHPHMLRAPQFTVVEVNGEQINQISAPPSGAYRGRTVENTEIEAALYLGSSGKIRGTIITPEKRYAVESVSTDLVSQVPGESTVAIYERDDRPTGLTCPVDGEPLDSHHVHDEKSHSTPNGGASSLTSGGLVLRIGALADDCYRSAMGGTAETLEEIESLYNAMSFIYERDVQVQIELAVVVIETSATTSCTQAINGQQALANFRAQWPTRFPNLAPLTQNMQLLTGRPFSENPPTIGRAYLSGLCNSDGYSINHMTYPTAQTFWLKTELLSHELGHNFSANHCNGQSDCGIMYASLGGGPLPHIGFGLGERGTISSYANTRSCLGTNPPGITLPFTETFPQSTWAIPYPPTQPLWTHNMNVVAVADSRGTNAHNFSGVLTNINATSGQLNEVSAELRTNYIDTRGLDMVYVTFEAKIPTTSTTPELEARYLDPSGVWRLGILVNNLSAQPGVYRQYSFVVPQQDLQQDRFRVSLRAPARPGNPHIFVDNIEITGHSALRAITPRGFEIAPIGDLDGDGFDDYMKSDQRGPYSSYTGELWFVSGRTNQERAYIVGQSTGSEFGASVRSAGDINHDGVPDVVVGAPFYGGNRTSGGRGMVRVLSGRDLAIGNPFPQVLLQRTGTGHDALGSVVDGGHDIDRDGTPDIIAGAPGGVFGGITNVGYIRAWSGATGAELFTLYGPSPYAPYGKSLQFIGAIDNGGFPAIVVSTHVGQNAGTAGMVHIVGRGPGSSQYGVLSQVLGRSPRSPSMFDGFGWSVAAAGDLDADGYQDFLVGAPLGGEICHPYATNLCVPSPGRVAAYSGRNSEVLFTMTGKRLNDRFGEALAPAGDVDADGLPDIIVGAPGDDSNGNNAGAVHLFSGHGKLLQLHRGGAGDGLGSGVAGRGDFTGDGRDDIVATAARNCTASFCQGEVRQFSGFPFTGTPIEGNGGGIRDRHHERPILEITGRKFSGNYRVTYKVKNAKPHSQVYILTGFQIVNQPPLPNSQTVRYAEPVHVATGTTNALGMYEFDFPVPTTNASIRLYHQVVEFDSSESRNELGIRASGIVSALYN